jgi:hypothetical protein
VASGTFGLATAPAAVMTGLCDEVVLETGTGVGVATRGHSRSPTGPLRPSGMRFAGRSADFPPLFFAAPGGPCGFPIGFVWQK